VAAPSSLAVTSAACVPTRAGGAQVTFTLSTAASVEVRVTNIAGRPVRAVCEGRPCKAGSNALLWDGRADNGTDVPAGLYLVTVTAASEQGQTAKALATVRLAR
jgi:flagellar hook assembly protein FlgD